MSLPRRLTVLGDAWSLGVDDKRASEHDADAAGVALTGTKEIVLAADYDPVDVLHEVGHALEASLFIDPVEHQHLQGLARGYFAVLRDNPSFRRWLWDQLEAR
jgi:DNA polymerase III psi subunit